MFHAIIYTSSAIAQRDLLFHYIDTAATTRHEATVKSTKTKQTSTWEHWIAYLISIGIESKFLQGLNYHQRNMIISGFAQAVREGTFSKRNIGHLVEGTVATTIRKLYFLSGACGSFPTAHMIGVALKLCLRSCT